MGSPLDELPHGHIADGADLLPSAGDVLERAQLVDLEWNEEGIGELVLVVEDESIAAALEPRFDELFATFRCVDPEDPEWRHRAGLRRRMRYWPGVLSA